MVFSWGSAQITALFDEFPTTFDAQAFAASAFVQAVTSGGP